MNQKGGSKQFPQRQPTRLPDYNYSLAGAYFVTIVTRNREILVGKITGETMLTNSFGEIVRQEWLKTEELRPNITLDEFVIMPNHFHAILFIHEHVGSRRASTESFTAPNRATLASPLPKPATPRSSSLSDILGAFKSSVTKRIKRIKNTPGQTIWQRSFHDRIIRNERELLALREYILYNPLIWAQDKENPIFQ